MTPRCRFYSQIWSERTNSAGGRPTLSSPKSQRLTAMVGGSDVAKRCDATLTAPDRGDLHVNVAAPRHGHAEVDGHGVLRTVAAASVDQARGEQAPGSLFKHPHFAQIKF